MSDLRTHRQTLAMAGANIDGAREKDDFYPTPPEMTHALLSAESFDGGVWEPACGDGAISMELERAGVSVVSTDLVDRGYGTPRRDFLFERSMPAGTRHIITNPPFKLGEQFWSAACSLASGKVAFLCRLTWLESMKRRELFRAHPLARVWICPWRPKFQRGRLANDNDNSGMLAHAWYVRDPEHAGPPELHWLERPSLTQTAAAVASKAWCGSSRSERVATQESPE